MTSVPMLDLSLQHAQVADEIRSGFDRVIATSSYILGPAVREFEAAFADYCGVGHAIGVGTGTDAIELALRGAGIGPGDDVVVPANTFVATAEAVLRAGATVVFADCDEDFLLDPHDLRTRMTPRTRAVIAVHLYGQTAAVDEIRAVVGPSVALIEDAAQAQGARYHGRRAGSLGDVAGTSFYPGKNLGAYGDGGAVMTSSHAIAERVKMLRNHGGVRKYEHWEVGTNSRLDSLQAVVLSAKLTRLDDWNAERRHLAERYDGLLAGLSGVTCPRTVPGNEHVYHQYVVRVPDRDRILAELTAEGIGVGIHYPLPVPLLPAFAGPVPATGAFPVAERLANEILSLPIYPGLTHAQQDYVAERLALAIGRSTAVVSGTRAAG
ncbi:DegT/DnrJ/EryC1/StrS family aminotransferase [Cryobacterium serini]|uniref:DegT/DnrJ/EryC1/StrS family aminotransferase n=1 Tax=Cryobacterium serini TaxID=1259201 RepID=A0A4R9BVP3_9MICO|nr:DegT/DnrJ/EryC1/StrS family aminotransferase [Cryobacterium serini]TFD91464.1 DegT/DnrJ/EryC1/StrS family aminotransferase [Cryobacterium serini]